MNEFDTKTATDARDPQMRLELDRLQACVKSFESISGHLAALAGRVGVRTDEPDEAPREDAPGYIGSLANVRMDLSKIGQNMDATLNALLEML